eukprot:gene15340-22109_t
MLNALSIFNFFNFFARSLEAETYARFLMIGAASSMQTTEKSILMLCVLYHGIEIPWLKDHTQAVILLIGIPKAFHS